MSLSRCSWLGSWSCPWSCSSLVTAVVLVLLGSAGAGVCHAQGIVDLRMVGPSTPIIPGQTFDVKLRAERQDPGVACSFVAVDCIVGWDPTKLQYIGISNTGSIPLSSSYLPSVAADYTGINEVIPPADGSLLYYALTPLGQPQSVPVGGVQVVTFRFKSISLDLSHSVSVIDNLTVLYPTESIVYDGVVPGVDDFGIGYAASITQLDCNTIFWYRDSDGDNAGDPADSTTSCTQPSGYVSSSNDTCPTNAALLAPVTYYADADADGFGALASPGQFCSTSAPGGYAANSGDCDDAATMYADGDGDGFGAGAKIACGGVAPSTDCNNADPAIYPGAVENCANDGVDNDCDGEATADAEAVDSTGYYVDGDTDGFGAGAETKSCTAIAGSVTNNADCDDAATMYADGDTDGFGAGAKVACNGVAPNTDCNDGDAAIYPGAPENCANDGVDNDCDGEATADAEAADSVNYYADGDTDGFGAGAATKSCTAIAGSVTNNADCDDAATMYADGDTDGFGAGAKIACNGVSSNTDCDDIHADVHPGAAELCANLAVDNDCDGSVLESEATDRPTWYSDADGDLVGDASVSTLACAQPANYVSASGDTCPADPLKLAPLGCGCGSPDTDADSDGNPDCFGQVASLSLAADQSLYAAGEQVVVRVHASASGTGLRSASLSIVFDASRLQLVSAAPVAGSAYSNESSELVDNIAGTLRYVVAIPGANAANSAAAALADLVFTVRTGASFCSTSGLVSFGAIGGVSSSLATTTTVPMIPTASSLGAISLLSSPPSFVGLPASASMAADAGTLAGAFVAASAVTAVDTCLGAAVVDLLVTYPNGSTGAAWPVNGMFPVGVTTLAWTATDAVGQVSSVSRTVTVANHQLLDVAVGMFGIISQNSTRTIRVTAGGTPQVFEMALNAGAGAISGVQVPVALAYPCILVKDVEHSLSKSAGASVSGVRYAASAELRQGDSNDDDIVDVLDFGIFVGDRGVDATRRGVSNFNSDLAVNNFDFQFLTISFFQFGDSCSAFDGPRSPVSRITVKELRRRGMGDLAQADVNHDGWLDLRDVQAYMHGMQPAPVPGH